MYNISPLDQSNLTVIKWQTLCTFCLLAMHTCIFLIGILQRSVFRSKLYNEGNLVDVARYWAKQSCIANLKQLGPAK